MVYILEQTPAALAAARDGSGGGISRRRADVVRHAAVDLTYRLFDKERRVDQGAIVENKFFGPLLAQIRDEQVRR